MVNNTSAFLYAENSNSSDENYDVDKIGMGYLNATGEIRYSLRNDLMFHIVMNKSEIALKGLICALKGWRYEDIKNVKILNPIDYGNCIGKTLVLDVKVELNNLEIIDIELQLYSDKKWEKRSVLYLCRAYDCIGYSEDYELLKPTLSVIITETKCMPKEYIPEFYSKFEFLNVKNHQSYSSLLGINVLYLDQTDLATEEDKENKLDYWAKLFKATTWEELKAIVKNNPYLEEVAKTMFSSNVIPQEKTILEAEERARHMQRCMYENGYDDGKREAEEEFKKAKEELDNEKNILLAQLEELKKQLNDSKK